MTSPRLDPKTAREQLGKLMRAQRQQAGFNLVEAAGRVGRDNAWLSKVERGVTRILPAEVEVLAGIYRTPAEMLTALVQLAGMAGPTRQSGLYRDLAEAVDTGLDALLRIEVGATRLRVFESQVVWALLQTEAYARAVLGVGALIDTEDEVEPRVELRMRRAQILTGEHPPVAACVLTEGALRQLVGGPEVMAEQLRHIADLAEAGRVEVRVLPFDAGAYAATNGAFLLAELPPPPVFLGDGPEAVAYQDTVLGCVYHRERAQIDVFETIWQGIVDATLSPKKSVAMLRGMADDLAVPTSTG
jgi:transcriptional regulator with XRE-family HTH domain